MDSPNPQKEALRRAAAALGSQTALALACGYADRRHVWPWFSTDRQVPAEKCPAIERATREKAAELNRPELVVTCEQLRPDVPWHVLREQSADATQQQAAAA
jgi:DNA-binding transcriptional regulator YdaS (Cro superfamily)